MATLFSKLLGVKKEAIQPKALVVCGTSANCGTPYGAATFHVINGKSYFYSCGC
ncbi:MAG: hypothetical protein K0S24_5071 [Sphingobacterium sp.]|jgi:hypothetical protein|nr:hypothetical protein [Sphingobacterium sp.]